MRWKGQEARIREMINTYKILVGKHEGKRPRGRSGCRWEDNIRMDLRQISCKDVDWMHLI
jgi:hypothetical protein